MSRLRAVARYLYRRSGLRCRIDRHRPMRLRLSGYRCATCRKAGAELRDFGLMDGSDYLTPLRTRYDRRHGSVERAVEHDEAGRAWRAY